MSDFYATAAHVVPETSSDERMHVLDDTCWCRPIIDTDAWQIRHNAAMSGAAMPDALRCSCGPHAIVFGEVPDPGCPYHGDTLRCEHEGCDNEGWTVLHFGPNMTAPRRVACTDHERVTDLLKFRDDMSTPPASGGES